MAFFCKKHGTGPAFGDAGPHWCPSVPPAQGQPLAVCFLHVLPPFHSPGGGCKTMLQLRCGAAAPPPASSGGLPTPRRTQPLHPAPPQRRLQRRRPAPPPPLRSCAAARQQRRVAYGRWYCVGPPRRPGCHALVTRAHCASSLPHIACAHHGRHSTCPHGRHSTSLPWVPQHAPPQPPPKLAATRPQHKVVAVPPLWGHCYNSMPVPSVPVALWVGLPWLPPPTMAATARPH